MTAKLSAQAMARRLVRVVHLIHSLEPGGAEAVLVDLARAAPAAGLELAVMPLVRPRDERYLAALRELDVPVLALDLPSRWDVRAFPRSLTLLREWQPDVVHTHLKHADLVGAVGARTLRLPMVSTLHVVDDGRGAVAGFKRRLAAIGRLTTAARTITVSEAQRRWYLDAFPSAHPDRVVTIHNGIADPGRISAGRPGSDAVRRSLGIPGDAVVVAQVGLLREGKGHHDLITALGLLSDIPDLRVLVVGDGPLRRSLELACVPVRERLQFTGYRDDVPALLEAADIVVQPSEFDALPTALIQALAAGLPIVATAVGGIPEIVTPGEGILVPPRNPVALARAIRALAVDRERRAVLGGAARSRFEQGFEATSWAARLRTLYVDVIGDEGQKQVCRAASSGPGGVPVRQEHHTTWEARDTEGVL